MYLSPQAYLARLANKNNYRQLAATKKAAEAALNQVPNIN